MDQQLAMIKEIRQLIARSSAASALLSATAEGARLAVTFPLCEMSGEDITGLIVTLATLAENRVELKRAG